MSDNKIIHKRHENIDTHSEKTRVFLDAKNDFHNNRVNSDEITEYDSSEVSLNSNVDVLVGDDSNINIKHNKQDNLQSVEKLSIEPRKEALRRSLYQDIDDGSYLDKFSAYSGKYTILNAGIDLLSGNKNGLLDTIENFSDVTWGNNGLKINSQNGSPIDTSRYGFVEPGSTGTFIDYLNYAKLCNGKDTKMGVYNSRAVASAIINSVKSRAINKASTWVSNKVEGVAKKIGSKIGNAISNRLKEKVAVLGVDIENPEEIVSYNVKAKGVYGITSKGMLSQVIDDFLISTPATLSIKAASIASYKPVIDNSEEYASQGFSYDLFWNNTSSDTQEKLINSLLKNKYHWNLTKKEGEDNEYQWKNISTGTTSYIEGQMYQASQKDILKLSANGNDLLAKTASQFLKDLDKNATGRDKDELLIQKERREQVLNYWKKALKTNELDNTLSENKFFSDNTGSRTYEYNPFGTNRNFRGNSDKIHSKMLYYLKSNYFGSDELSVLDRSRKKPIISPSFISRGRNNVMGYMFSIENLAWKDRFNGKTNEFGTLKSITFGPNGGRIMWFPPYDLKFNETTNAQWNSETFIGRGEPVYTYVNTERTGNLSFKMIVDYPKMLDFLNSRRDVSNEILNKLFHGEIDETDGINTQGSNGIFDYLTTENLLDKNSDENNTANENELEYRNYRHLGLFDESASDSFYDRDGAETKIQQKLRHFIAGFHSSAPDAFNTRLTFLHQCTRQGPTNHNKTATNLAFGRPPVCVLRIGDFYNQKIVIDNVSFDYEGWDLNPGGIGVQPMLANITISFKFIGGGDLAGPVQYLQNAVAFNFYANTRFYITGDLGRHTTESGNTKYEDYGGINFHHGKSDYGISGKSNRVEGISNFISGKYVNWGENSPWEQNSDGTYTRGDGNAKNSNYYHG